MTDRMTALNAVLSDCYRIEHELGEGGMATVYLARDLKHERDVAIKVLELRADPEESDARFEREIRIAARLSHPHILTLHDSGTAADLRYYVMPFVRGESLRDRLRRDGRLPIDKAVGVCAEVAEALDHAHRAGIVHRDIKPENILLHEGHALVADFGIASAHETSETAGLTLAGVVVGTPAYLSPEQVNGTRLDGRSDLYSLACVLYECLTGEVPFTGTLVAMMAQRLVGEPPSARSLRPDVAEGLAAAIQQAMAVDPDARFPTGAAFVEALRHPVDVPGRSTKPAIVVLPFANVSPDAENEYFADGLTEEILTDLSKVTALSVISRTSAMRYKGTDKDVRAIGRELGVRYVLEGSVRKAGSQLRITAKLIDAANEEQLWAEHYNGTMDEVFEVQERVAREIVKALDVTLTPDEDRRLTERPVANVRAFELYLQARQEIRRYGPPVERGLALLARAKQMEGDTIPLRALEALGKINLVRSGLAPDQGPLGEAERTARAILEEAPGFAYARGLLGYVLYERTGSAHAAEVVGHIEAALEQDPNDPDFLFLLGTTYGGAGLNDEMAASALRLLACDPLSPMAWLLVGLSSWFVGRAAEALPPLHRSLELDPVNPIAHWCAGYTHALCGQLAEAKQHAEVMRATAPDFLYTGQLLGLLAAIEGDNARALSHVRGVAGLDGHHKFHLAETFCMAGDRESALALLEDSVEWFHPSAYIREYCPFLAPLRGLPRFEAYAAAAESLTAAPSREVT